MGEERAYGLYGRADEYTRSKLNEIRGGRRESGHVGFGQERKYRSRRCFGYTVLATP